MARLTEKGLMILGNALVTRGVSSKLHRIAISPFSGMSIVLGGVSAGVKRVYPKDGPNILCNHDSLSCTLCQ